MLIKGMDSLSESGGQRVEPGFTARDRNYWAVYFAPLRMDRL
jgi:hypothetical protein